ncbi:long-chain fatty acid--CoA ligase [Alteribacillus sp. HJP-4]|uniref:LuxE/PaaK family acyltransferase n=1 Tax=Alteribacillus sp. HJP-4 TaxID=2775394 RepID=UPI0035CD3A03
MNSAYQEMKKMIKALILEESVSSDEFFERAKQLFAYQYHHNQPYRKFCRRRRVRPAAVQRVTDIPPIPIQAFKEAPLLCSADEEIERTFMTSGTTNPNKRGKNGQRDLEIYDLSTKVHFKKSMLPDVSKMKMILLFPEENELPNSSLAHYLHVIKETFGAEDSEYVVSADGFDKERLSMLLKKSEEKDEPVFILGATFSIIAYLDECVENGISYRLPAGSRIMDTGGSKGYSREIEPLELKKRLSRLFSIPEHACGNMYGMTELSSQIYDQTLRLGGRKGLKRPPHWLKTIIVDPETLQEKREGEAGIIVHYDLANINSVAAIMTEDIGKKEGDGFHLLGRAAGTEAKGCSLALEEFLSSRLGEDGSL